MFRFKPKIKDSYFVSGRLKNFLHLLRSHTVLNENFLDSLSNFSRIFDAHNASIYLFEKKTSMFLLRKWTGQEPTRYSIAGNYEFISFLKNHSAPVHRKDFVSRAVNEMRQAALYYFQQTLSNVVCPIIDVQEWFGLLNMQVDDFETEEQQVLFDSLLEVYVDAIKRWLTTQTLVQENRRLSEMSDIKNQLLSNVTHELQTPLNGILGISEALLDNTETILTDDVKTHIQLIQKSGKALNNTVSNILKLVQIEAKKSTFKKEKFSLLEVIKEVALLYSEACQKKNISIKIPKSQEEVYVFAHPDQIRTVLMNLIGNAVKFTQQGEIAVQLKKSGETMHVAVSDTGIGIDDEKLSVIFEEFCQADGSHTRLYGGTGLGLAIAKKIITLHNGRIWAESQKGEGSCFTFTLPMYPV